MNQTLGAAIRQARKSKGLTLAKLAALSGPSPSYISKIENDRGEFAPSERTIRALAEALGVDAEPLILLARKIPGATRKAIAASPAAQAFLRGAAELTDKDWNRALIATSLRERPRLVTALDATHLRGWADRLDSRGEFPRVVRDLVQSTTKPPVSALFRAGEGVDLAGWDGLVTAETGNTYVPSGTSGWELSTRKDVATKASQDYQERAKNPEGLVPSASSFVAVTLRRWPGKHAWATARKSERVWRDVRAYDADDLEAWLDLAPAVLDRLSRYLGVAPEGSVGLETFWRNWTESTDPPLTARIVTAGREHAVRQIHERFQAWAQGRAQTLEIRAGSREEALAIFAASVFLLPNDARDTIALRSVLAETQSAWRSLVGNTEPLILVPRFNPKEDIAPALRNRHLVVLALDSSDSAAPSAVEVGRLSRELVSQELISAGLPEERARALGVTARRGLPLLVRELAVHPPDRPRWASPEHGTHLAPLLLAGAWNDSVESDQHVIVEFAGSSYRDISRQLARWASEPDPPLRLVKDRWSFVSRPEAWRLLAPFLTTQDLDRLVDASLEVLSIPDPAFDVPNDKRWMARALGALPRHSEYLREGLCESLALAGALSEEARPASGPSSADYAARAVRRILERANRDWKIWASLELSLLAEAAPDEFLDAVLTGLEGPEPVLCSLFRDTDAGFFSSSPHTGLLWALEMLAWDPNYLGQATQALAGLAGVDPGGKLGNRPHASLRGIFLPWHPQTYATLEQRFDAIDSVLRDQPTAGWQLLQDTLPESYGVGMNTPHARFRNWGKEQPKAPNPTDYTRAIQGSMALVLRYVGTSGERWSDVITALPHMPPDQHDLATAQLSRLDPEPLRNEDRARIWHALRILLSSHRSYSEADWALPRERIEMLAGTFARFTPMDLTDRYAWLFAHHAELPEGRDRDWTERDREVEAQRQRAVREIFGQSGAGGILELAARVEEPQLLGLSVGRTLVLGDSVETFLAENLAHSNPSRAQLAWGVCVTTFEALGRGWLDGLATGGARDWIAPKRALLLLCLPLGPRTWETVARSGSDVERAYWETVGDFFVPPENALEAIPKLLDVQRPAVAALVAYRASRNGIAVPADVIGSILEALPKEKCLRAMDTHTISDLLASLEPSDSVPPDRIAGIEWMLLPLLKHGRHRPRFLLQKLASDPHFYFEVLCLVYRAEDEEKKPVAEQDQLRARLGHQLLDTWRTPPGTEAGGKLDGRALSAWVRAVRGLAKEHTRAAITDQMVGQMLSGCPVGTDGSWPHEAIRDLFQEVRSREIEHGLQLGRFNSRGVVSKSPFEGGVKERALAEEYKAAADKLAHRWPRTAALLRRMAISYESDARREDGEAELREDNLA